MTSDIHVLLDITNSYFHGSNKALKIYLKRRNYYRIHDGKFFPYVSSNWLNLRSETGLGCEVLISGCWFISSGPFPVSGYPALRKYWQHWYLHLQMLFHLISPHPSFLMIHDGFLLSHFSGIHARVNTCFLMSFNCVFFLLLC